MKPITRAPYVSISHILIWCAIPCSYDPSPAQSSGHGRRLEIHRLHTVVTPGHHVPPPGACSERPLPRTAPRPPSTRSMPRQTTCRPRRTADAYHMAQHMAYHIHGHELLIRIPTLGDPPPPQDNAESSIHRHCKRSGDGRDSEDAITQIKTIQKNRHSPQQTKSHHQRFHATSSRLRRDISRETSADARDILGIYTHYDGIGDSCEPHHKTATDTFALHRRRAHDHHRPPEHEPSEVTPGGRGV